MNDHNAVICARLQDPVCGMEVDPTTAAHRLEHDGKYYYFCGARCADAFRKNPQVILERVSRRGGGTARCDGGQPDAADAASGKYVCAMCPGVESDRPAACPKCGMALEPAAPLPAPWRVHYTCPMHPEVIQDGPGDCPKCGMALDPMTVSAEEKNPELKIGRASCRERVYGLV